MMSAPMVRSMSITLSGVKMCLLPSMCERNSAPSSRNLRIPAKEKILAAKRAGIKEIILSDENRKNIEEIQEIYLKGLTFHYVKDVKEVFAIALTDEKVADAIDLSVKKEKIEK